MKDNEMTVAKADKILADPSTHFWVKEQFDVLVEKDCLDAYYDALLLAQIMKARLDKVLGKVA